MHREQRRKNRSKASGESCLPQGRAYKALQMLVLARQQDRREFRVILNPLVLEWFKWELEMEKSDD